MSITVNGNINGNDDATGATIKYVFNCIRFDYTLLSFFQQS